MIRTLISIVLALFAASVANTGRAAEFPPRDDAATPVAAGGAAQAEITGDVTGTWRCCGLAETAPPAQTWTLLQTGDVVSGQARRPDGSLLGTITGRRKPTKPYVPDVVFTVTGSSLTYGGYLDESIGLGYMHGVWGDDLSEPKGSWDAGRLPEGPAIAGKVTSVSCTEASCKVKPLRGVTVVAKSPGGKGSATTDAAGAYRIRGLPAGSYTVTPHKGALDFDPHSYDSVVLDRNRLDVNFKHCESPPGVARAASGPPPEEPDECDNKIISGHVTDLDRKGYEGTCVSVVKNGKVYTGTANANGFYAIEVPLPGLFETSRYDVTGCGDATLTPRVVKVTVSRVQNPKKANFQRLPRLFSTTTRGPGRLISYLAFDIEQLPKSIRQGAYEVVIENHSANPSPAGCIDSDAVRFKTQTHDLHAEIQLPRGKFFCTRRWTIRVDRMVDGDTMLHDEFVVTSTGGSGGGASSR